MFEQSNEFVVEKSNKEHISQLLIVLKNLQPRLTTKARNTVL